MEDLVSRFYQTYANLPIGVRDEIVAVVDGVEMTWNVIKLEVDVKSPLSTKVLKYLDELKLLKK